MEQSRFLRKQLAELQQPLPMLLEMYKEDNKIESTVVPREEDAIDEDSLLKFQEEKDLKNIEQCTENIRKALSGQSY